MLSWREFNNNNPDEMWRSKSRKTRLMKYQEYLKKEKEKINLTEASPVCGSVINGGWIISPKCRSFADCTKPQPPVHDMFPEPVYYQQEGINPMNYATATVTTATTETQDQRKYLTERLREVYNEKRDGLEAHFGLIDDDAPNGPDELAERLKEGKFIIRGADKDNGRFAYWAWFDLIQWRDPSRKEDTEGFKAAVDELKALRQAALDTIKIDEPKAGLDAVKALEAWTPTGAAN